MTDIVDRLRSWVYTDGLYATAKEAADEIERLRHRVRFADAVIRSGDVATLTDAEREAVDRQAKWLVNQAKHKPDIHSADLLLQEAATLRGLLERLK